jgi:glycosyltransferase 2 family protein
VRRLARIATTLLVTGLCTAYLIWKIDLRETLDILADANLLYFLAAVVIVVGTTIPMAWRWQRLLAARGTHDSVAWMSRAYLVSFTAGQILPTAVGGDAVRILETSRRHPGRSGPIAGSIVLERALGAAATLVLAAIGFLLAIGRYDVGAYLWLEFAFVAGTALLAVLLFARRARPLLRRTAPLLRRVYVERPVRAVYEGIHAYRNHVGLLVGVFALTIVLQALRILAIWLSGEAVGIDLSPRPYFVMGPLLFLVVLLPVTINGLAVRESFFVSFLGGLGVDPDAAFAAGFLFFLVTITAALPGGAILAWEGLRGVVRPTPRPGHG